MEPDLLEHEKWFRRFLEGRGDTIAPLLCFLRGGRSARPETRARAALIISRIYLMKGCVELAHAYLRLSATFYASCAAGPAPSGILVNLALIAKARGERRRAARLLDRALDRALRRGETLAAAKAAANLATCIARDVATGAADPRGAARACPLEDAAALVCFAERSYRALGDTDGLLRLELTKAMIEARRGRLDDAVEGITAVLSRSGAARYERERIVGRLLIAELFLSVNERERARTALDCAASSPEALGRFAPLRLRWLRLEGDWHRRAGALEAAERFSREAAEIQRVTGLGPLESLPILRPDDGALSPAREPAVESPCAGVSRPGLSYARRDARDAERFITADADTASRIEELARAARLSVPILITGESGVGKELAARGVHRWSGRGDEPFVPVNVAALPGELFESILFGHERGAFTGAVARTPGLLAAAGRGTVFLDEIGELPSPQQAKLLRLLDRGEYIPVGQTRPRACAARIVAATNRDLEAACAEGRFRADLYYRLAAYVVRISPLRERRGDIAALARALLERAHERHGLGRKTLGEGALAALERYAWPGNVRELEGEMLRAAMRAPGPVIRLSHLSPHIIMPSADAGETPPRGLRERVSRLEREEILGALRASGGRRAGAAALLGVRRTTLIGMMKRLRIDG